MNYLKFWKALGHKSNGFSSTTLLKDELLSIDLSHDLIREAFSNLKFDDYNWAMRCLRVFDGYHLSSDATQSLIYSSPMSGEIISDWMERVVETNERFIIFNNAERQSEGISKEVANLIEPLQQEYDFGCMICEANLILGKYGPTPLGIHYDNPMGNWHKVLQINMGPGKKKMHFWKRSEFQELTNSNLKNHFVSKDELDRLVKYAETYEMEKGDALFFSPEEYYHIAESDEFSISLSLVLYNEKKEVFQQNALKEHIEQAFSGISTVSETESSYLHLSSNVLTLLPENNSWINQALIDAQKKLKSNKHLSTSPAPKKFPFDVIDDLKGAIIYPNPHFKIMYQSDEHSLDLFIRGRKIMLHNISALPIWIDQLNEGKTWRMEEVIEWFDAALDSEAILFLIQLLYENSGIQVRTIEEPNVPVLAARQAS